MGSSDGQGDFFLWLCKGLHPAAEPLDKEIPHKLTFAIARHAIIL